MVKIMSRLIIEDPITQKTSNPQYAVRDSKVLDWIKYQFSDQTALPSTEKLDTKMVSYKEIEP